VGERCPQPRPAAAPRCVAEHHAPPSLLTAGLTVGTGLDEEDVERRREVSGCLVLLVRLVERHEEILLDRQGGLVEQEG